MIRMRLLASALLFSGLSLLPASASAQSADRGGFTFIVDLGVGIQQDSAYEDSGVGLAGLNAGVGGFLTERLGLMFRVSGTHVTYDTPLGDIDQASGFAGPALQYWLNERFNLEGGVGVGFWGTDDHTEPGLGLMLGAGVTLFNRGKHNLQFGIQYAPAFTDPEPVHNIGFTLGYQFL